MAGVVLTSGSDSVDLGYPATASREYAERSVSRRTIGGRLRTTVLSASYTYSLTFTYITRETYDDLTALWADAVYDMAYPTVAWSDGPWAEVATGGVSVGVSVGPFQSSYPDLTYGDFDLTLSEELPR